MIRRLPQRGPARRGATREALALAAALLSVACNDLVAPDTARSSDLQVTTTPAAYQYTRTSANLKLPATPGGQWSAARVSLANIGNAPLTLRRVCLVGADGACAESAGVAFRLCEGRDAALDDCAPPSADVPLEGNQAHFVSFLFTPPAGVVRAYDASLLIETDSVVTPRFFVNAEASACRAAADGLTCLAENDRDGDGVLDDDDNCVDAENPDQLDSDGDGAGDACDGAPETANYRLERGALPQAAGELKTSRYAVTGALTAGAARSSGARYSLTGRLAP